MRTIKFRAWDKTGEEMIENNNFFQLATGKGCHLSDFFTVNKDGTVGKQNEHIVWMQFTGLLDKNGKEIFEGDIVRGKTNYGGNSDSTVEWDDSLTGFEPFNVYDTDCDEYYEHDSCEIIGNIYENPELTSI